MRKIITALLLGATLATPLAAQGWQDRRSPQADRGARDGGQRGPDARADRGPRPDRVQPTPRAGAGFADPQADRRGRDGRDWNRGDGERGRDWNQGRGDNRGGQWDRDRNDNRGGQWDRDRNDNRGGQWNGRRNDDRGGQWNRGRGDDRGQWSRDWRNDRRYDWQGWRSNNRNAYRLPRYYAPRGYAGQYRRWSPGYRIQPYFYGQSYWISDPWSYRLPPAYGGYRWVRYYDDVMLIDVRSGLIADVIHSFFY